MTFEDIRKKYGIGTKEEEEEEKEKEKKKGSSLSYSDIAKKHGVSYDVDEDYLNSFIKDSKSFSAFSVTDEDKTYGMWNKLNLGSRASNLRGWLYHNKSNLDEKSYKSLSDTVDSYLKLNDYFSQWESEDKYKEYVTNRAEYNKKRNYDLEQGKLKVDKLQMVSDSVKKIEQQISDIESENQILKLAIAKGDRNSATKLAENEKRLVSLRGDLDYAWEQYGSEEQLQTMLNAERSQYKDAERLQNGVKLAGVSDPTSQYYDSEFDKYVKAGIESGKDTHFTWFGWENDALNMFTDVNNDYIIAYREDPSLYNKSINSTSMSGYADQDYQYAQYMTDEEYNTYAYYYGKYGKEKAREYLDSIVETLNMRSAQKMYDSLEGKTAQELLFGVVVGLDQFGTGIENLFSDKDYIPASPVQMAGGMVREDLADNGPQLPEWMGGASLGQVGYDMVTTTSNMLPSILVSSVAGPGAGAALLGASASGNAYAEMLNLGYTKEQARSYSILVGASETALQYALGGIGKLGGKLSGNAVTKFVSQFDNAIARVAIQWGGNMLAEGLEESIQSILEPWFKSIATGEEIEGVAWDEVIYSGLMGALSAGILEGGTTILGEVSTYKQGAALKETGTESIDRLVSLGKNFSADSVAYQLAGKVNEQTGAYTIGRLFNEVGATLSEQNKADIASALGAKGMTSRDAKTIAKWLGKAVDGGYFSKRQIAALESNDVISSVFKDLIIDQNSTVNQRIQGYNESLHTLAQEMSRGKQTAKTTEQNSTDPTEMLSDEEIIRRIAAATGEDVSDVADGFTRQARDASVTENTPVEQIATEGKFKASETGKAKIGDTEVSIKEIASIKDGEMILRLEDDSTVNANDVEYGSSAEALIYENVADMNLNAATANAFVKGYDPSEGLSAQEYVLGFREAYRYGEYGFPVQEMSTNGFSAKLSPTQRSLAYDLGKTDIKYKISENQSLVAKIASTEAINAEKIALSGKVHYAEGISTKGLTNRQKASLKGLERLSEALGIDFHIFESEVGENGKRQGANGWFDPKDGSIHIDLHAGLEGEGTILFTASHELTHFIREWSPEKFKGMADFLMEKYGEKGVSVDALVRNQISKAKRNGRDIDFDTAYEEVIADSFESMLADGDIVQKITELKAKDKTLWEKIKNFITDLVAKIKAAYKGLSPDSIEGRYVAEMLDAAEKLKSMWTEALVEASENNALEKTLGENGVMVDSGKDFATLHSVRDILDSKEQQKVAEALAERFDVTVEEAKGWISAETSLASLILNPKYSQYLDYVGDTSEEAIKSNSDYPQGTVDFSNICKKRRDFTEVMNRVLRNFPNHVFAATDLAKIRTIMEEEGMEVACAICYVEDRRQLDSIVAQDFIDSLAIHRQGGKIRPDGKPFNANQLKAFKLIEGDTYTPSIYELISLEGRNALKAKNPAMEEAWVKFNNARGMQSVRLLLNDAEYKRQILKYTPSVVSRKNDLGGLRIYSFSDMEMFHLIDIIQVITDSATVGLSLQGYTKVNEYAKAVKDTGEKLNRSLIPKGDLGYHMEDGKVVLDYDTVEGIDINHPDFFDNIDNPSVGNIVIGINATQIRAAMKSKFIDQIIPFHTGQSNEVLGEKGIAAWVNYKDFQSERDLSTGKKSSHQINIYTEVIQAAEAEGKPITNKVDFVNKFLEVCKANSLQPRFSEFLNVDENGDYTYTEGYHKFLVDFKTFDQNTGEYLPQMPVKPIFDNEYLTGLLKEYVKTQKTKDAHFAETMPKVLDRITDEIVAPKGAKYSVRDIVGDSGTNYGVGVYLDSTLLTDLTEEERVEMVKEYVKELGGSVFTAYDKNGNAVDVHLVEASQRFKNKSGKRVPVNKDLTAYLNSKVKQEAIALVDELISTSTYMGAEPATHPHDWVDNNGANDWDVWTTYIQDKEKTVWEAKLRIANSANGEKILYDIFPIEKVEQSGTSDTSTTDKIIAQPKPIVKGENAKNSLRNPASVSNRSLLANALESVAQNDIERNKLKEYKGKIALIESEQAKLADTREKIRELSFAKGKRDTEAIKQLQFEANQSASRINTYDRQLLNLESTKALKGVLEREKKLAYKKAEREGKDALAKYREKAAKTQRELLTRYQESRAKGVEGRRKTEMRHKIKDVVNELSQYLKNTKEKHVPIGLQKPVAEALAAVNMDTVGAAERIAKKQEEMRAAKSLEEMQKLSKEIEHIQEMGGNMEAKLSRLKTAYDSILNSDDPLVANAHDDVISNTIDKVIEIVGETPLRDMSLYQLEAVYDMYRMILTTIRSTNKAFKAAKGEEISTMANGVIAELMNKKRKSPYRAKAMQTLSEFDWNNLKPVYVFERIGSANFTKVFNAVRAGEDVWATDMGEAQAFREEQFKKYKYNSWDFKKKHGFATKLGDKFELDLGEIMSLYAYAKDEHSKGHLTGDGFVFDPKKEVVEKTKAGIKVTYNVEDATSYNISEEMLGRIIGTLTPEQKAFADAMQEYLSTTMGEKGNEVSLALYDIKLFKKKDYFPLKVSHAYMAVAKEKAQGDVKIKNKGFTKERKEGAKNPIVLTSFMDVWADHVNEMSMYHAFTLPLEDFYRVFNYKAPGAGDIAPVSVNSELINAHGNAAVAYIEQLLKDINGGARSDPRETFGKSLMSKFKKASVIGSLSVVIQQPSAIVRAMALVDAKYFVGNKVTKGKHKDVWVEVKKYAPVAVIKEMGYFDTGMGKGSVEWLKGEKTFMDKVDDVLSKAPALADELTWCSIWNAVKRETVHTNKHLAPNSEAFLKAVGERFTEVIVKTQVYDSTLSRSANMRSKGVFMNMVTSFMAEPTTSINMLQDAFRKGNKKYIARTLGAVYGSVILNSALVSLVYAMRDDDEDETFLEKYLSRFVTEVIDGVNPLTYFPFVKDIWSAAQGFDIERADMSLITEVTDSLQQLVKVASKDTSDMDEDELSEHKKAVTEALLSITDNIASLVGVPVKNVRRDIKGVINFFDTVGKDLDGRETTSGSLADVIGGDVKDSVPVWGWFPDESKGDKLYDAIINGDKAYVDRLKSGYKDDKAYESAVRKALRENDSRIHDAAVARYNGNIAEYTRIAREIIAEGNFKQDDVVAAINSEINTLKKGEGKTESTKDTNKVESIYKVDDYFASIVGRDQASARVVKEDIIKADIANGKDREEAEADFNRSFANHLHDEYEAGNVTERDAVDMLVNYGGKTEEAAESKVQYWEFKEEYPNTNVEESWVSEYYADGVADAGISIETFIDYRNKVKGMTGETKKQDRMAVINSLPITSYQKDALYYAEGWAASKIYEAPWH